MKYKKTKYAKICSLRTSSRSSMKTKTNSRCLLVITLAVFCASFLSAELIHAATYYVATNGSDTNTCSQARSQSVPKRTMNGGIGCLSTGDTLEVKAGTYAAPSHGVEPPSGTSWDNPTTVKRFGSDVVTLQGTIGFGNSGAKQYIVWDGFIIDGQFCCGAGAFIVWFGNGSHHIKLSNNEIKNGKNHGVGGCSGCWITGNKIHTGGVDCGGNNTTGACPSQQTNLGYNNAIYAGASNQLIEYNEIYDWSGTGIQVYTSGTGPTDSTVIRYNWIHDSSGSYGAPGDGRNGAWGIVVASGDNLQVYGNVISNLRGVVNGPNVTNSPYSILVHRSATNAKVYNNTIYNNPAPGVVVHASGAIIKNNIFWKNSGIIDDHGTGVAIIASNNLCDTGAPGCSVISNPLFVDPAGGNFQLQAGSPAINAGASSIASGVNWSYDGSAADIGAYEYRTSSPSPSSSPPSSPSNLMVMP